MPKFVVDDTGERVFTCADQREAEQVLYRLTAEKRKAYIAEPPKDLPDWVKVEGDILTVEGLPYERGLFQALARDMPVGDCFRLTHRANGTIGLLTVPAADILAIEDTHAELEELEAVVDEFLSGGCGYIGTRAEKLRGHFASLKDPDVGKVGEQQVSIDETRRLASAGEPLIDVAKPRKRKTAAG